jgi:hypothetical protein
MKSLKLVFIYGFLNWLIPFAVALLMFSIRQNDRPLFESIMPVVVTFSVAVFSILYFKKVDARFLQEGILLGAIWFFMDVVIDVLMFSSGPMKMGMLDYFKDIGLTYVIIPIVTVASGFLVQTKTKTRTS